jgi:hypothetical protein
MVFSVVPGSGSGFHVAATSMDCPVAAGIGVKEHHG